MTNRRKKEKPFRFLVCPVCKSKSITLYMGAQFGKYMCKSCGYVGAAIIEEKQK